MNITQLDKGCRASPRFRQILKKIVDTKKEMGKNHAAVGVCHGGGQIRGRRFVPTVFDAVQTVRNVVHSFMHAAQFLSWPRFHIACFLIIEYLGWVQYVQPAESISAIPNIDGLS